jgi:hypothetical protein
VFLPPWEGEGGEVKGERERCVWVGTKKRPVSLDHQMRKEKKKRVYGG